MQKVVRAGQVDAGGLRTLLSPRDDILTERADGDGSYACAVGPFRDYRRTVSTDANGDGMFAFIETTEFRLALPIWGALFVLPVKGAIRNRRTDGRNYWWAPPARLDQRSAVILALLCTVSLVAGYLGTLITQTITFAAAEFHTSKGAQGTTLAAVRIGVLLSLVLVSIADRRGRRRMLIGCAVGGCLTAALGAAAPNMVMLGATQTLSRAFSTALALLIAVVAVEETPAGARAYAVSVMAMTAALGAGICVMVLPVADDGIRAWRILYAVPLLFLPLIRAVARKLPESRRFSAAHAVAPSGHGRRLWLLAVSGFLVSLFVAPASQFQNEFLRTEEHFSALKITLFTLGTNTPGGIGVVVGGKLADIRGRRLVAAVGLTFGAGLTAVMYLTNGPQIWFWSLLAAVLGAATVPALGVYGPELFPTSLRGRANGIISVVSVVGSGIGLLAAGWMADRFGTLGPGLAILCIGPLLVAVLVVVAYPETAMLELEEINPEDRPPDPTPPQAG